MASPSTRLVSRVTLAAFLLPAGSVMPSLSSLSLRSFPPSLDLALLRTPPRREALRHSGGDSLLCTSATVTLYLEVEDNRDSLPGVEQKTSVGCVDMSWFSFVLGSLALIAGNRPTSESSR